MIDEALTREKEGLPSRPATLAEPPWPERNRDYSERYESSPEGESKFPALPKPPSFSLQTEPTAESAEDAERKTEKKEKEKMRRSVLLGTDFFFSVFLCVLCVLCALCG